MHVSITGVFVTTALLLLVRLPSLTAIDLEGAKESTCFDIKKTVPLDLMWAMSQSKWYYPLMSRMDLYMTAVEMSGKKPLELREDEVYYDSCMTFQIKGTGFSGAGFNGKSMGYHVKPVKGMEVYEFYWDVEGKKLGGTCYNVLTDNKTFAVVAVCMANKQMTWGVMSTVPRLPAETVKKIHDHMESLGFKREYFTGIRYDHCDLDGKSAKQKNKKNEL